MATKAKGSANYGPPCTYINIYFSNAAKLYKIEQTLSQEDSKAKIVLTTASNKKENNYSTNLQYDVQDQALKTL